MISTAGSTASPKECHDEQRHKIHLRVCIYLPTTCFTNFDWAFIYQPSKSGLQNFDINMLLTVKFCINLLFQMKDINKTIYSKNILFSRFKSTPHCAID